MQLRSAEKDEMRFFWGTQITHKYYVLAVAVATGSAA
jgi:hypothetical protein